MSLGGVRTSGGGEDQDRQVPVDEEGAWDTQHSLEEDTGGVRGLGVPRTTAAIAWVWGVSQGLGPQLLGAIGR